MTDPALAKKTTHGRFYTHPGNMKSVPSITNIKDMKSIKGLPYWAARESANYAADNRATLATLDREAAFQLVRQAPWRSDAKKAQSSLVGDIVHAWIDETIKGGTVNPDLYTGKDGNVYDPPRQAKQMWRQFAGPGGFLETYKPRWVMSEFTVWSNTYDYAGTADWGAYIGKTLVLGDTKSGKEPYPDVAMQLAALANADFILEPDGTETEIPRFERFAVLHVRPTYCRLVPVERVDEWFKGFLGLRALFDCVVNYEDKTLAYAPKIEVRAAA